MQHFLLILMRLFVFIAAIAISAITKAQIGDVQVTSSGYAKTMDMYGKQINSTYITGFNSSCLYDWSSGIFAVYNPESGYLAIFDEKLNKLNSSYKEMKHKLKVSGDRITLTSESGHRKIYDKNLTQIWDGYISEQ